MRHHETILRRRALVCALGMASFRVFWSTLSFEVYMAVALFALLGFTPFAGWLRR